MIRSVRTAIIHLYIFLKTFLLELFHKEIVVINGFFQPITHTRYASRRLRNWGDALNYYLFEEISRSTVVGFKHSIVSRMLREPNYLVIGSIIAQLTNENSVIWGSGVLNPESNLKIKPKKVCAVRGPLTRSFLLDNGVECPEIYGDPALLLPLFYKPLKKAKYSLGIIPHHVDEKEIKELFNYKSSVKIISLVDYSDWKDVIDDINLCDFVISSSLHGLIVSDAYDIPNMRFTLSRRLIGGDFKFNDYYASVQKPSVTLMIKDLSLEQILAYKDNWTRPTIDLELLIRACPFDLSYLKK